MSDEEVISSFTTSEVFSQLVLLFPKSAHRFDYFEVDLNYLKNDLPGHRAHTVGRMNK